MVKRGLALALAPVLFIPLVGCNVVIGLEKTEPYPANCGADFGDEPLFAMEDDRNGHCYSVVRWIDPDEEDTETSASWEHAKNSCTINGYLACINDRTEFDLIAQRVPGRAWLGLVSQTNDNYYCITGERFEPDYRAWAEQMPQGRDGETCVYSENSELNKSDCDGGADRWVCEFEPLVTE